MNVVVFGGTGGLGSKVSEMFGQIPSTNVIPVGSKDVDVRDYDAVQAFFSGREVDVVINLSGVNYDTFAHKITKSNYEAVNAQLDTNIRGTINIVSNCLPYMREKQFGRIITASSILAERPVVGTSVYAGCKGFIDSFTKTIALENANKNITCNSIQLGYFDSGLTWRIPEEIRAKLIGGIPMGRLGMVEELFNTITFLIGTSYVTGTNIKINGGLDF